ncbi:MAG: hypothetical protein NDF51_02775 [archaeon YNP-WB-040]|nr:hypothetical protein [Candidatus Culexarchaeum yellowstonense]
MSIDFESLSDVLKHPIRRKIILTLFERGNLSYVDLMNLIEVSSTGKLNYHLKILGDLIGKDQNGRYTLTEKGLMIAQLLQKFPERKPQPTTLSMGDATVIGFIGMALTLANPTFWTFAIAALLKLNLELYSSTFPIIGFLTMAYALIVPGAVIWLLTVKHTNSHDIYDLMRPPMMTFTLLLALLAIMLLMKADLMVTIKSPAIQGHWSVMQINLQTLTLLGLIFPFIGVIIAELISRFRKVVKML